MKLFKIRMFKKKKARAMQATLINANIRVNDVIDRLEKDLFDLKTISSWLSTLYEEIDYDPKD